MIFFKPSKAKPFNYKPVYLKDNEEGSQQENINFSDKMHQQWNRIPYSKLVQNGKRRIFSIAIMTIIALYLMMKGFEYMSIL